MTTKSIIRMLDTDDLGKAGRVIYRAFSSGFRRHGYPEPIPDSRAGTALAAAVYATDPSGALILESSSGRPIGVGFFQRANDHVFIGPIAVDPDAQSRGHGRRLLSEIIALAGDVDLRLLQDAFNPVSFRLYARAGFATRESLALLVTPPGGPAPGPIGGEGDPDTSGIFRLRDYVPTDFDAVCDLDLAATRVDRRVLLERLAPKMHCAILDGKEGPRGFACAFAGRDLWVLGPGQAEDGRTLAAILVGLAGRCVRDREAVAVFAPASRVDILGPLFDVGFRVSHLVNLMVRGAYSPSPLPHLPILPVDTTSFD
jgi:GNAT superfamily N-acetyltransferase